MVVQLAERAWMRAYKVGLSLGDLRDKLYTMERTSLGLNDQETEVRINLLCWRPAQIDAHLNLNYTL